MICSLRALKGFLWFFCVFVFLWVLFLHDRSEWDQRVTAITTEQRTLFRMLQASFVFSGVGGINWHSVTPGLLGLA